MNSASCCGGGVCMKSKSILKGIEFSVPNNMTITDYFRECLLVESTIDGDKPAILCGDGTSTVYTFNELDSLSTKFAKALRKQLGFWTSTSPDGDLVMAFALPISEIIPVVILGILKLGGAFLAIPPTTFAEQHIIKLVAVTKPMLIIIESSAATAARYQCVAGLQQIVTFDELWRLTMIGGFDDINEVCPLETLLRPCKRMASIVYTAGTMDQQLAVRIGHREILNRCLWQYKRFPYESGETAAVTSGLEDVDSISEIFAPLLAGIPLHLVPKNVLNKPALLIGRISDAKLSRITLSPPQLDGLLTAYEEMDEIERMISPLSTLRYWIVSGDTVSLDLAKRFFKLICSDNCDSSIYTEEEHHNFRHWLNPYPYRRKRGSTGNTSNKEPLLKRTSSCDTPLVKTVLIHLYGSTEMMSDVSYETFENCWDVQKKFNNEKVSIGKPIGNTIIYVVDEDMKIVEEGTIGEICVAGACVASGGYVTGVDEDDSERFRQNPFTKNKKYINFYETEDYGRIVRGQDGVAHLFFEGRTEEKVRVNWKIGDLKEVAKYVTDTKLVEQCCVFCYHAGKEDQTIVACCKLLPQVTVEGLEKELVAVVHDADFIPQIFPVGEFHYLPSGRLDKHKMFKAYKYHLTEATSEEWEPVVTLLGSPIQKSAAKVLFTAIAIQTRKTLRTIIKCCQSPMWSLGVKSCNALSIFLRVKEHGYVLDLQDFLKAATLLEIVLCMQPKTKNDGPGKKSLISKLIPDFQTHITEACKEREKERIISFLSKAYSERHSLNYKYVPFEEYKQLLELNWAQILKDNLSVCAYTKDGLRRLAGVCIALDAYSKCKIPASCCPEIKYMNELVNFSEQKPKEHVIWTKKGTATQVIMMASSDFESPVTNIILVIQLMEAAKLQAMQMGYHGAMISTANPFARDLCEGILHLNNMGEVQLYKFRAKDKTAPFRYALHHEKLKVFYEPF